MRSLSLGLGQVGGGVILVVFTGDNPPFELPGFHFLAAAFFAGIGGFLMVYVCLYMCKQNHSQAVFDKLSPSTSTMEDGLVAGGGTPGAMGEVGGGGGDYDDVRTSGSHVHGGRSLRRRRAESHGGFLVKRLWGRDNSISLNAVHAPGTVGNRRKALSTLDQTRTNRPAAFSTGAVLPGVR